MTLVLVLKLTDDTTKEIALLDNLVFLGLKVGNRGLEGGFLGLHGSFVGVKILNGAEEDGFLTVCLVEHVAEPGVVDTVVELVGMRRRRRGGSDDGKFEPWRGSTRARKTSKG